jgi:hypothetical protein
MSQMRRESKMGLANNMRPVNVLARTDEEWTWGPIKMVNKTTANCRNAITTNASDFSYG